MLPLHRYVPKNLSLSTRRRPAFHALLLGAWLLLGCATNVEPGPTASEPHPLALRRVTAAVKRKATRLIRLETDREALLTTPEHPFATPGAGWISAGRLVAGDWIVSERFGAVRLLSVRSEAAARPVPVFNLSVASSHAYFVGTEHLLVHNTKCRLGPAARQEKLEQLLREREELNRQISAHVRATPNSPRIAELTAQRKSLQNRIDSLRTAQRREQGPKTPSKRDRLLRQHEDDRDAASQALEAARKELAALERKAPTRRAERAARDARKAELEKQIAAQQLSYDRANSILSLMRELARLEQEGPATQAEQQAIEARMEALRAQLKQELRRETALNYTRQKRSQPEARKERTEYERHLRRRLLQRPIHLADTERPRDPLELLEDELARRRQEAPSESRDEHIHHLTDQIETMKRLVEIRRAEHQLRLMDVRARYARTKSFAQGKDTSNFDEKQQQIRQQLLAFRAQRLQLRAKQRLLTYLERTPWARPPESVDEARLRDFERQLAEGIASGLESEQQLGEIERALDAMAPPQADWQEPVLDEAHDVDELLNVRDDLMQQSPSPERSVELQQSYERLQHELREERRALEVALSALANEHAHVQTTQAASSSGPTWQDRLRSIQEEQQRLRADWRARLQTRLDSARWQLHLLRSIERFRDEAIEADLAREIALFERELQRA